MRPTVWKTMSWPTGCGAAAGMTANPGSTAAAFLWKRISRLAGGSGGAAPDQSAEGAGSGSLINFCQRMKTAGTLKEMAAAVFGLVETLGVSDQLTLWRRDAVSSGRLDLAGENDQVWDAFLDLLDQMVDAMGERPIKLELFSQIIDAGFEGIRLGLIPRLWTRSLWPPSTAAASPMSGPAWCWVSMTVCSRPGSRKRGFSPARTGTRWR